MERLTSKQIIHDESTGKDFTQTYILGHKWGPAYFKRGTQDYDEYSKLLDRLAAYEDLFERLGLDITDPSRVEKLSALVKARDDGRVLVLPCRISDAVDRLFSHNEVVALWYDKPDDKNHSYLLWKGMAWDIPKEYQDQRILKFEGIIPERFSESDTINLLVTPYITPRAETEAALSGGAK